MPDITSAVRNTDLMILADRLHPYVLLVRYVRRQDLYLRLRHVRLNMKWTNATGMNVMK